MRHISPIKLFLSAALALFATSSYAQENNDDNKPEIVYTAEHPKYVLGGLTVDGVKGFDETLLLSISGLEVGQSYEIPGADISEAIHRYWEQKLFSNVSIEADSIVGSKIYLHIKLTAQPRISSINYSGVKKSEREDLEASLGLAVGSPITPNIVDQAKIIIKRYFDDKGFKNAEVDILRREDVTGDNRELVDIVINKHEKIKVNKIYITGVDEAQAKKLKRAMMKTHEKHILNIFRSK